MGRLWEQFKLDWEQGLHRLPVFTQRTAVALLGVLVAMLALLGGLATVVRTPPRQEQGSPGAIGGPATTLPATPPGGGKPGTPGAAPLTTAPGGGGGGGGAAPTTTGGGAPGPTTTTTDNGGNGGGLPPVTVTVTVTLPLPHLPPLSADADVSVLGGGQP